MSKNELRSSGERRRRGFANGAGELHCGLISCLNSACLYVTIKDN